MRKIITKLSVSEVSAVDSPAQASATVVLIKRHTPPDSNEWAVVKGMFMDALEDIESRNTSDNWRDNLTPTQQVLEQLSDSNWALRDSLETLIKYDLPAKKKAVKSIASEYHEKVSDMFGQITSLISKRGNLTMTKEEMAAQQEEIAAAVAKALGDKVDEDGTAKIAEAVAKALEPTLAKSADLVRISQMKPEHQEYLSDVEKSAGFTDEQKAELRKKFIAEGTTDEAREKVVKAWGETAEVFKAADGTILKRSELGNAYDPLVAQIKKNEETTNELDALKKQNADADMIAKNRTEFPNLPGDDEARLAIEKTMAGLDEEAGKKVREMLKASNTAITKQFETFGSDPTIDGDSPEAQLNALVESHVQKSEGKLTTGEAYLQVIETEKGNELYEKHVRESATAQ